MNPTEEYLYCKNLHEHTHWSPQKAKSSLKLLGYSISARTIDRVWSECLTCGKAYGQSSHLNYHMKIVHFGAQKQRSEKMKTTKGQKN